MKYLAHDTHCGLVQSAVTQLSAVAATTVRMGGSILRVAVLLPMLLSALAACSSLQERPEDASSAQDEAMAQSDTTPRALKRGESFAWRPAGRFFYDAPRFTGGEVKPMLEDIIVNTLTSRGLQYAETPDVAQNADLWVGYIVVLGGTLSDADMQSLHEKEPELKTTGSDPNRYEKGTLVIKLLDAKTQNLIWRGSVEGFTNLDMFNDVRLNRLRDVVQGMFTTFPVPQ